MSHRPARPAVPPAPRPGAPGRRGLTQRARAPPPGSITRIGIIHAQGLESASFILHHPSRSLDLHRELVVKYLWGPHRKPPRQQAENWEGIQTRRCPQGHRRECGRGQQGRQGRVRSGPRAPSSPRATVGQDTPVFMGRLCRSLVRSAIRQACGRPVRPMSAASLQERKLRLRGRGMCPVRTTHWAAVKVGPGFLRTAPHLGV